MSGRACSTAIIPESRITCAPATFSAADVSADFNFAPWAGGRRMAACSRPGNSMSPEYLAWPVTFSNASLR